MTKLNKNKNQIFTDMHELLKKHYGANLFECFNENAHSKFLVYLFKKYPKLLQKFINEILNVAINLEDEKEFMDSIHNIKLNDNYDIKTQEEGIDILIKTDNYIFVIEVKLDAKINLNKNGKTQLEKYYNYINSTYIQGKNPKYNGKLYTPNNIHYYFLHVEGKNSVNVANQKILDTLSANGITYNTKDWSDVIMCIKNFADKFMNDNDKFNKMLIEKYIRYWNFYNKYNAGYTKILKTEHEYKSLYDIWEKLPEQENIKKLINDKNTLELIKTLDNLKLK